MNIFFMQKKMINAWKLNPPSLGGLSTVTPAFLIAESPSIIAQTAAALRGVRGPMTPNALPVYPNLTLAHAPHVQG